MISQRSQFGHMLTTLGLTGEAAEIGVAEGGFSFCLLDSWPGTLHMIDCWEHLAEGYKDGCNSPTEHQEWRYKFVCDKAKTYGGRAVVHRAFSHIAVKRFADGALDFVYLDANHAYPSITEDLRIWWPKVKAGGILAGHDFLDGDHGGSDYGVKQAVLEFAAKQHISLGFSLEVNVIGEEWPSFWIRKPS